MAISDPKRERLERLAALPEEIIDTSDIPEILDWSDGIRGGFSASGERPVLLRLDPKVVDWFRRNAKGSAGFQTAVNQVLRRHVEANSES